MNLRDPAIKGQPIIAACRELSAADQLRLAEMLIKEQVRFGNQRWWPESQAICLENALLNLREVLEELSK